MGRVHKPETRGPENSNLEGIRRTKSETRIGRDWSDRLFGPEKWSIRISDFGFPSTFRISGFGFRGRVARGPVTP